MSPPGYCRSFRQLPRLVLERAKDHHLEPFPKRVILLEDGDVLTIGSASGRRPALANNARFSGSLDKDHAVIRSVRPGALQICNTSTTHGVVVDGLRLSFGQKWRLEQGSVITLEDESDLLYQLKPVKISVFCIPGTGG
ncbi:hypothetical protein DPSP01_012773 [Paraphaeosphaeria sporulosa]|uniref:FHA domain-containing protein n=1 Tax=Paraphaeosphaeria sporulosa TaxID=1460663 RepID=A0A177BU25_9PLEO|nr:uncharacterized protein CC84DRAFT_1223750 [Paraphaeosphaeria sporulosa]OAF98510.1 hypothetical protein CC84DRAFT_1223750 [Paraphaeosphaeria sporulosa]